MIIDYLSSDRRGRGSMLHNDVLALVYLVHWTL